MKPMTWLVTSSVFVAAGVGMAVTGDGVVRMCGIATAAFFALGVRLNAIGTG
jgi:hypothetical protein